jgi:hypothetical protein
MSKENGGPAFPIEVNCAQSGARLTMPGMTLRDYFAGQALAGWLASYAGVTQVISHDNTAEESYKFADAMLAEREK